jgi:hypothetical protein
MVYITGIPGSGKLVSALLSSSPLQPHVGKDNARSANDSVLLSSSIKPVRNDDKEAASAAHAQPSFQGIRDRLAAAQDSTSHYQLVAHC